MSGIQYRGKGINVYTTSDETERGSYLRISQWHNACLYQGENTPRNYLPIETGTFENLK